MLISLVEAVSCENPQCADFAKVVDAPRGMRQYYCATCGRTSPVRAVDAEVLKTPASYAEFLRRVNTMNSLPS
jgi:hypothetical protein